tara:strand:+ start:524 stop:3754 length:3231 start_codon:yes stop_codon:yes gene_type:complete
MKIALLPGGFKPPHLGHYNMAKYLANFADKVIVRIGQKERDGIGKELALEIWSFYKEFDPDPRSEKLIISVAQSPSPVKDVYDFVEKTAPEGSTVILGLGEKDSSDGRYNNIPKFAEPRNIKADIELVPPQAGGISGTRMREIIKANDKDEFFKFIPDYLPEEIKEEIWTKLVDTTMPIQEFMGGTMNKQEMAKHMANMKKLRSYLNKVDSHGQMVQVPSKLTQGLRRKLYEGRYDIEILMQSRYIINQFKASFGEKYEEDTDGFIDNVEYTLELKFIPTDVETLGPIPYVINAQADDDTVVIQINYNVNDFPQAYNDLVAEIKDTLRHELEHVGQYNFNKGVEPDGSDPDKTFEYLTLSYEIPAFVQGLYKTAKTKKITLTQAIDDFLGEREAELTDEESAKVKQIWTNWAKENLPAAQLEEGDPKKAKKLGYTEDMDLITKITEELIYEELCKRGKAYIAARKRAGEKSSAYLSGRAVRVCKGQIKGTKGKKKKSYKKQNESLALSILKRLEETFFNDPQFAIISEYNITESNVDESLKNWFGKEDWVRIDTQGNIAGKCGTMPKGKATQRCLPRAKANSLTKAQRASTSRKKVKGSKSGKQFVKNTKKAKVKLNKEGTFTQDWWLNIINEEILNEDINEAEFKHISPKENKIKDAIKDVEKKARLKANRDKPLEYEQLSLNKIMLSKVLGREELGKEHQGAWEKLKKEYNLRESFNLNEGGAAGHMAHPFDLPNVNTGRDLIKSFEQAANSLKKEPGAVKIDGVNASIRLINLEGKREFAMDRGSKKALDLKGITKADLEDRFGAGHGMIKAGGDVLDIFNDALPSTENELKALGLWENPNVMFNMEYVSGKSNVQDYGKNFLALHGLLEVETKEVQGARKMLTKRITTEKSFNQADMDRYLKALEPFAKKKGFEIYGSVPTTFTKDPDFKNALGKQYKIEFAEGAKTKSLAQWLNDVTDIPADDRIKMNLETGGTKDVGALSKQVYFAVFGGETIDDLFDNEQDIQKAIQGATTYLATEKLGDEILDVLDSPMGSVNDHEGVVIRDPKIHSKPFKITGKFITGGVSSDFQKK